MKGEDISAPGTPRGGPSPSFREGSFRFSCLLIALLSELPQARGLGIDLSEEACRTAAANAALNGVDGRVTFRQGSWTEGPSGRFDIP